jgi:hypothetical protein
MPRHIGFIIIIEYMKSNTAANAVGSSGGSGGIMPKLRAIPAANA